MNKPLNIPVVASDPEDYMRRLINYSFAIARMYGKADGGEVSHAISGPHTITAQDLIGTAAPAGQQAGAYTDAGGQQIAAPFVSSMSGGYPVYNIPSPSTSALPPHVQEMMDRLRHRGQRPGAHSFPSPFAGGYAEGGPVDDAISLAKMIADNRAHYDEGGLVNKVLSYLHGLKVPDPVLPIPTRLPTRDEAIETAKAAITPVDPYEASGEAVQQYRSGDPVGAFSTMAGAVPLQGMAKKPVVKRSTELPDISTMPREQAIAIARKEPHLIPAGDQSEGFYVGSPRDIMSKRGLTNRRKAFDAYVAADPRGSDWYDRYRNAVTEVTGQDPRSVDWMTKTHGMMSAGVDPGSETQFALRETNGQIAGMPVKAARPAQHEALQDAINARDPSLIMLGDKTGEYARLIHPDQTHGGATGVNDFRHARNWGYTEASGADQRDALTQAQHRFMDFETALAVDRANKIGLGGKFDWTGEQLQAAPWVRQKALAIAEKRKMPYEEAFQEANKTIADFFPKHTAFATHEAIPGPSTGHLPGLPTALQAARDAYSADPRSLWNNAPGGRDAIYSGLGVEGTGVNMRVRPSIDMQGADQPKGMDLQFNRGQTARPLVAFDTSGPAKTVAPADTALLNTGELVRAYIDARDAGAWHKPFLDAPAGHSNSYFIPMDRKATLDEIQRMRQSGREHGIGDVEDTGQGMTVTSFDPGPPIFDRSGRKAVENALALARPEGSGSAQRAFIDSGYLGLTDEWQQGIGSGAATRKILGELNQNPQLRAAFDNNPYIPANALARMERDAEYAAQYGATRQDIQNARRIIGEGPGWVGRLEKALKDGVLLPALGAAILAPAMMQPDANAQSGG